MNENASPQLGILNEYEYSETRVLAGISPLGEMIAIKPICENLGIDRKWQQDKIKTDPSLGAVGGMVKVLSKDGKKYDMYCLPPAALNRWLFGLTATENIKTEIWDSYKEGLVIHLLMMLKMSLDEITRLRKVERDYTALRQHTLNLFRVKADQDDHTAKARDLGKEYKSIQEKMMVQVMKDPNQLSIGI